MLWQAQPSVWLGQRATANAGAWGTALAIHCAKAGHASLIWALEHQVVNDINDPAVHQNTMYLQVHSPRPSGCSPAGRSDVLQHGTCLHPQRGLFRCGLFCCQHSSRQLMSVPAGGGPAGGRASNGGHPGRGALLRRASHGRVRPGGRCRLSCAQPSSIVLSSGVSVATWAMSRLCSPLHWHALPTPQLSAVCRPAPFVERTLKPLQQHLRSDQVPPGVPAVQAAFCAHCGSCVALLLTVPSAAKHTCNAWAVS